ncbi:hypothetical protein ACFTWS_40345 [Streptomyces sp. NPDC057027]|uniref:hypothetical protein n=1 Tax=Streptomyces sp. NPDC057027 TaxID=3346004 RepID=UPI00363DAAFA
MPVSDEVPGRSLRSASASTRTTGRPSVDLPATLTERQTGGQTLLRPRRGAARLAAEAERLAGHASDTLVDELLGSTAGRTDGDTGIVAVRVRGRSSDG